MELQLVVVVSLHITMINTAIVCTSCERHPKTTTRCDCSRDHAAIHVVHTQRPADVKSIVAVHPQASGQMLLSVARWYVQIVISCARCIPNNASRRRFWLCAAHSSVSCALAVVCGCAPQDPWCLSWRRSSFAQVAISIVGATARTGSNLPRPRATCPVCERCALAAL